MIYIDKYAYISKLKHQDPIYKLVFCMMTLGVCLWANSIIISIIALLIMGWHTVCKGGIPCAIFMKLMIIPMSFLAIGVLTVGINVSDKKDIFLFYISVFDINAGVTQSGIQNAAHLFFKALGAVSCLYYLSLNTPMVDILQALGRLRVPKLFIELMSLIYRFIFVLLETVEMMLTAQKSRMGYSGISSGYRSLAALASTLFIRAYKRSDELYTSLEARGYDGELNALHESYKKGWIQYTSPITVNLILIAMTLIIRHFTGGLM
ncbi:MAG: cobalt ECF transporter T component CbiQ [Bacillota bacterium]|nr:cobalt ECF transporter T component CbiQ [Bacillota bacterium]